MAHRILILFMFVIVIPACAPHQGGQLDEPMGHGIRVVHFSDHLRVDMDNRIVQVDAEVCLRSG